MDRSGEIRKLTQILRPHISVITNVGPAHLVNFNSVEEIADAKCEIFEGMCKETGIAIINQESEYYRKISEHLATSGYKNVYTFGSCNSEAPNSKLELYETLKDSANIGRVHLIYNVNGVKVEVKIPIIPEHMALNFTIPLLIASILGLDLEEAGSQLSRLEPGEGRGKLTRVTARNGKPFSILCDYYNANPVSMVASLKYLGGIGGYSKKIAVLGDMLELGPESVRLHRSLISPCLESGAKKIYLIGSYSKYIYEALVSTASIEAEHFNDIQNLIEKLEDSLQGEELVLIKGSRGSRLERIVQHFVSLESSEK
jgi:UDP-N-acetylmuramoyl-tripeptide--D-alanyl-D-alanine ligase